MARDEQSSNGNGRSNGSSGKSGRQDSPLSARRARLRSLARQALPPDPYSKGKPEDEADPASSLELEPMDQSAENGDSDPNSGAAPAQPAAPQPQDAWLEQSLKLLTPSASNSSDPNAQNQTTSSDPGAAYGGAMTGSGYATAQPGYAQFPQNGPGEPQAPYTQVEPPSSFGPQVEPPPSGFDFSQAAAFVQPPSDLMFQKNEGGSPEPAPANLNDYAQAAESIAASSFSQNAPFDFSNSASAEDSTRGGGSGSEDQSAAAPHTTPAPDQQRTAPYSGYTAFASSPSAFSGSNFGAEPGAGETANSPTGLGGAGDATQEGQGYGDNHTTFGAQSDAGSPFDYGTASGASPSFTQVTSKLDAQQEESEQASGRKRRTSKKSESEPESPIADAVSPAPQSAVTSSKLELDYTSSSDNEKDNAPSVYADDEPGAGPPTSNWGETPPLNASSAGAADPQSSSKPAANTSSSDRSQSPPVNYNSQSDDDRPTQAPGMSSNKETSTTSATSGSAAVTPTLPIEVLTKSQVEALELLGSIDQALGVCAMNLSAMKTAASEQTEALKNLKETLQNQTFFEIGLNLNTLMESMSAALEPMKAVGELVPAIDQLVSTMVGREERDKEMHTSPDRLAMALADQLGSGQIDPWTFKRAYMAIYPDEHPADLLRRLVELLGTQRLSGELFRAAYDAVQAAEPAPGTAGSTREVIKVVPDPETVKQLEEIQRQFDELKRNNEELKRLNEELRSIATDKDSDATANLEERERDFQRRIEEREQELLKRLEERESEYADLLAAKEQEIQDTQDMLHSRFEEFNSRYEELVETVNQRDEELKSKEDEVARKESEVAQLKAQLDEIKEQFRETVEDMQKQLSSSQRVSEQASKPAPAAPTPAVQQDERQKSSGFFDAEPKGGFLDSGPARPLFQQQMDTFNSMSRPPAQPAAPTPGPPTPVPSESQPSFPPAPPTAPIPEPSNQAVPRPPQNQGIGPLTQGSYGSGVRAQVFEVIVRQALAGAPWKEICAGPMQVNNITPEEVEAEVRRRETLLKK